MLLTIKLPDKTYNRIKSDNGHGYCSLRDNDERIVVEAIIQAKKTQAELLDYIKLSIKHSDEFKEKYKSKYKESNSQNDLYYSHLFEGMAEAYDDILKKMGEEA